MNPTTLISVEALHALSPGDALIVDCRFELSDAERGAREFASGHIPGAMYADLNRNLSDLSKEGVGRHPLPDATRFASFLSRIGWSRDRFVVAYDDTGGALAAARFWWMLRLIGHRNAAVLDGGIKAWIAAGYSLERESESQKSLHADIRFDASQIVMTDELQRLRTQPKNLLIDARGAVRYRGESEPIDRVAGHVPGAVNRPFTDNLDASGKFKSSETLRKELEALLGAHNASDVVHMCGSGVTACHNFLAMEHAGLNGSRIYAPSWSGWIADPQREVAIGAA